MKVLAHAVVTVATTLALELSEKMVKEEHKSFVWDSGYWFTLCLSLN